MQNEVNINKYKQTPNLSCGVYHKTLCLEGERIRKPTTIIVERMLKKHCKGKVMLEGKNILQNKLKNAIFRSTDQLVNKMI